MDDKNQNNSSDDKPVEDIPPPDIELVQNGVDPNKLGSRKILNEDSD